MAGLIKEYDAKTRFRVISNRGNRLRIHVVLDFSGTINSTPRSEYYDGHMEFDLDYRFRSTVSFKTIQIGDYSSSIKRSGNALILESGYSGVRCNATFDFEYAIARNAEHATDSGRLTYNDTLGGVNRNLFYVKAIEGFITKPIWIERGDIHSGVVPRASYAFLNGYPYLENNESLIGMMDGILRETYAGGTYEMHPVMTYDISNV